MIKKGKKNIKGGFVVGGQRKGKKFSYWMDTEDTHCLLIGASRSGKSRKVISPSIWTITRAEESMVLTDPKGELYQAWSNYLENEDYNVIKIDLRNPFLGHRVNFLQPVLNALYEENLFEAEMRARTIGRMLTWKGKSPEKYNSDPIWPDGQESLTSGAIMAVALEAPPWARHLGSVRKMIARLGQKGGKLLDKYFESLPDGHIAKEEYDVAYMAEDRLKNGIFTGTGAQLKPWASQSVIWLTSEQEHDLDLPAKEKTAIFVVIPDEEDTLHVIASLYLELLYQALIKNAQENNDKLPRRVNFLLDEFGILPPIPKFDNKISAAAGRNIRFLLAVQGLKQLDHKYGREVSSIITSNCQTWVYISTNDIETPKIISEKTGRYTVQTESRSRNASSGGRGSEGVSRSLTGRPLLMPDEVARWPVNQSLILKMRQFPAKLPLQDISEWPVYSVLQNKSESEAREIIMPPAWMPRVESEEETASESQQQDTTVEAGDVPRGNIFDDI